MLEDGDAIPRCEVTALKEVCLPVFVLGMWHAALMIPERNSVGETTINEWCPSTGGGYRDYSGSMGANWLVEIEIKELTIKELPIVDAESTGEETESITGEPIEDVEDEHEIPQLNQFLAKPKVNIHHDSGDIYSNIGTIYQITNYPGVEQYYPDEIDTKYFNLYVVEKQPFTGTLAIPKKKALTESIKPEVWNVFGKFGNEEKEHILKLPSIIATRNHNG